MRSLTTLDSSPDRRSDSATNLKNREHAERGNRDDVDETTSRPGTDHDPDEDRQGGDVQMTTWNQDMAKSGRFAQMISNEERRKQIALRNSLVRAVKLMHGEFRDEDDWAAHRTHSYPDIMECHVCGVEREVHELGGIVNRADPTQTYKLVCGHVVF
jgi:hypothetical protein